MADYKYVGSGNLDAMSGARNYNSFIFGWIINGIDTEKCSILDFGAGSGEFANRFSKDIIAVEPDASQRRQIKHRAFENPRALNEKFDLIYSINVLEHIEDDAEAVRLLHGLLKNNGRVKILVPAFGLLFTRMDELVGHFRRYEKRGLVDLVSRNGFEVVSCGYFDSLGFLATLLYKALGGSGKLEPRSIIFYDRFIFPASALFDRLFFRNLFGKNIFLEAVKCG